MGKVKNLYNVEVDFETSLINYAYPEVFEAVLRHSDDCVTEQQFFTRYEVLHYAMTGEEWNMSKRFPVYAPFYPLGREEAKKNDAGASTEIAVRR